MTIQKPIIEELRYVNGQPDPSLRPDQTRLNWAKNGESMTGASGDTVSDGVLNRPAVQVQENVVNSHNNTKAQQVAIEEVIDTVNDLTGGGSADLGSRITQAEFDIDVLDGQVDDLKTSVGVASTQTELASGLHLGVESVTNDVGVRNTQDVPNEVENNDTVRKDLFFIKRRIGNDYNYDVNGNPQTDNPASGMKYQIDDLYNRTSTINAEIGEDAIQGTINGRIYNLEQNSQSGSVAQLRLEMGETVDADAGRPVYLRLDDVESTVVEHDADITLLQETLETPTTGVVARVTANETAISLIGTQTNDNTLSIQGTTVDIGVYLGGDTYTGSMKGRLSYHDEQIDSLWGRLGTTDETTGTISYRVKELEDSLGDSNDPAQFTAWYSIRESEGDITTLQAQTQGIIAEVGTSDTEVGTLRNRVSVLEQQSSHALITSEEPDTVTIPTTPTDIFSLVVEEADLDGFSYNNGVLTRTGTTEYQDVLTIAWVVYEPDSVAANLQFSVEIVDVDTNITIHDFDRKLRADLVSTFAITKVVSMKPGSTMTIKVSSDATSVIEHDSLTVKL
ncbi:hypothetical protein NVP1081O_350 [Vibrio phage 1.081.O._10N.286.52.C2]|nr:hypothetical protein NVP1081O_350 [Vibrio phage 1.081.O._10N.286.52.C2]